MVIRKNIQHHERKGGNCQVFILLAVIIGLLLSLAGCANNPASKYEKARTNLAKGKYEKAIEQFTELGNYEESNKYVMYIKAIQLAENEEYEAAIVTFQALKDFLDSDLRAVYYSARYYETILDFYSAIANYNSIPTFLDSAERTKQCPILQKESYDKAKNLYTERRFVEAQEIFKALGKYDNSPDMVTQCESALEDQQAYNTGCTLYESQKYEEAIEQLRVCQANLGSPYHAEALEMITTCEEAIKNRDYSEAVELYGEQRFEEALEIFIGPSIFFK